jgi:tetratricopeptide (TPR) repeat protein
VLHLVALPDNDKREQGYEQVRDYLAADASAVVYNNLAALYMSIGEYTKAKDRFERSVELKPSYIEVRWVGGRLSRFEHA